MTNHYASTSTRMMLKESGSLEVVPGCSAHWEPDQLQVELSYSDHDGRLAARPLASLNS